MQGVRIAACAGAIVALVGCGKVQVEGTYTLDKAAMAKALDEKVASVPEAQRGMARLAAELVKTMDVTLTLSKEGKAELKSTMPDPFGKGQPKTRSEALTWERKGPELTLAGGRRPLKCSFKQKNLHCSDGKDEMVFVRN